MARERSAGRTSRPINKRPVTLGGEDEKARARSSSLSSLSSFSSASSPPSSPERSGFSFLRAWSRKAKRTVRRRPVKTSVTTPSKVESEDDLDEEIAPLSMPSTQDDANDDDDGKDDKDEDDEEEAEAPGSPEGSSKQRTIATQTTGPLRPVRPYKKFPKNAGSSSSSRHHSNSEPQSRGYHRGRHSYHGGTPNRDGSYLSSYRGHSREGSYHSSKRGQSREGSYPSNSGEHDEERSYHSSRRSQSREGSYHSNKGDYREGSYHSNKGEYREGSYHSNKGDYREGSYHSKKGEYRERSYHSNKGDYREGSYHSRKGDYREGSYHSNKGDFRDESYRSSDRGGNRDRSFGSYKSHSRNRSYGSRYHNTSGDLTFTSTSEDGLLDDRSFSSTNSEGRRLRSQGRRGRRGYGSNRSDTSRANSSLDMSRESAASTGSRMSSSSGRGGHFRGRASQHRSYKDAPSYHKVERAPYRSYYGRRHNLSTDSGKGSSVGGEEKDMFSRRPETLGGELPPSEAEPKLNHSWRANRYSKNRHRSLDSSTATYTLLRREESADPAAEPAASSAEAPELPDESITKLVAEAEKQLIKDPLARQPSPVSRKRSHGRNKPKSQDLLNTTARTVDSQTSSDSGRSIWTSMKKLCRTKLRHKSGDWSEHPVLRDVVVDDDKSSTSSTPRKERRRSKGHVSVTEARPSCRQPREFPASDLRDDWKGEGCRYFFGDFTCLVPEVLKDEL